MRGARGGSGTVAARLDKCARDIHHLKDRIHRLKEVLNNSINQQRFRYFELRDDLERVMTHLGMQFIDLPQDDFDVYETVSSMTSSSD